jgi:mRNA interferase RelE/StbE
MKVKFNRKFLSDIKTPKDKKLKEQIKNVIIQLEEAQNLSLVKNIIKIQGYSSFYRIRIGDYRIGIEFDNEKIEILRFLKKNDIYKVFP